MIVLISTNESQEISVHSISNLATHLLLVRVCENALGSDTDCCGSERLCSDCDVIQVYAVTLLFFLSFFPVKQQQLTSREEASCTPHITVSFPYYLKERDDGQARVLLTFLL